MGLCEDIAELEMLGTNPEKLAMLRVLRGLILPEKPWKKFTPLSDCEYADEAESRVQWVKKMRVLMNPEVYAGMPGYPSVADVRAEVDALPTIIYESTETNQ